MAFGHTKTSLVIINNILYDPRKITGFAKITSWIDSIRYNYGDIILSYYDKAERLCDSNNVKHEFTKIYGKNDFKAIKGDLDSLQNAYVNRNESDRTKRMDYISIDFSLPYGSVFIGSSNVNNLDSVNKLYKRDTIIVRPITKDGHLKLTKVGTGLFADAGLPCNITTSVPWYSHVFPGPFAPTTLTEKPRWGLLEDISQSYYDVKIESITVDSITLKLDFVGATEFSLMEPMPDRITMSGIEFNNPVKIFKIRANGLRFHAQFKELENIQQIRVFFVTAIMSGFVTIFIVFLICFPVKFYRWRKNRIHRTAPTNNNE